MRTKVPQIVPAVLAEEENEFLSLLRKASQFAPLIQLDFMDGEFVPSKSLSPLRLPELVELSVEAEAHLMVKNPADCFIPLRNAGVKRAIFHVEAVSDAVETIGFCRKAGLEAGIAVNPDTDIRQFIEAAAQADEVLFMTVYPGYYGRPMVEEVLGRVAEFKRKYPEIPTSVDGGVKLENVEKVASTGVDRICVGSAVMKAEDPARAYEEFVRRVRHAAGKT